MKTVAITIALNAERHLNLQTLHTIVDKWIIVEGASESTFCTSWCNTMPQEYHDNGASVDGTSKAIESIKNQIAYLDLECEVIHIKPNGLWPGKVNMFNEALKHIDEECYLWEVDADEVWQYDQIHNTNKMVSNLGYHGAAFMCNYYLSKNIIVRGTWGESTIHGYNRMWMYKPGMKFLSHEPPRLSGATKILHHRLTPRFNHYSYYHEEDVIFKSKWYKMHENIHEGWTNITSGKVQLPCSIESLFRRQVPEDWKDTIITYS